MASHRASLGLFPEPLGWALVLGPVLAWSSLRVQTPPAPAAQQPQGPGQARLQAPAGQGSQGPQTPRPLTPTREEDQDQRYFETIDRDGGGWISFAEAHEALDISRDDFFNYDKDKDARVTREEFSARYREIVERTGNFVPPKATAAPSAAPPRSAEQLRNAFDTDFDGRLGPVELEAFLVQYPIPGLNPALILSQLDADQSGRLELSEVQVLSSQLDKYRQALGPAGLLTGRKSTVLELFGEPEPRGTEALPEPSRLPGPLPVFARLDIDRSGLIDGKDLFDLQYPLSLPVRGGAVLAALDQDGDGSLTAEEFRDAFELRDR